MGLVGMLKATEDGSSAGGTTTTSAAVDIGQ